MKKRDLFWMLGIVLLLCVGAGVNDILRFARADGVVYVGAAMTNNGTLGTAGAITSGGSVTVLSGNLSSSAGGNVGWGSARANLSSPSATAVQVNSAGGAIAASFTSSNLTATHKLSVGPGGGLVTNILTAEATLDFPTNFSAGFATLQIAVTGAAIGDVVSLGLPADTALSAQSVPFAFASNDTVYVRRCYPITVAQDPPSGTYKVMVFKQQ